MIPEDPHHRKDRVIDNLVLTRPQQDAAYRLIKWALNYFYDIEFHLACRPQQLERRVMERQPDLMTKMSWFIRDVEGSEGDEQGRRFLF